MDQTRNRAVGLCFPSMGALVALIGLSVGGVGPARAQTQAQAQAPSPWLEVSSGQPTPAPDRAATATATATATPTKAESEKVHGTITVDFEKVTIAELLRLTRTLEQVDGVIHIVSSRAEPGDDPAVVTISRSGAPALILGEAEAASRFQAQLPAAPQPPERPAATAFPRLASLGRMLGLQRDQDAPQPLRNGPLAVTWEPKREAMATAPTPTPTPTFEPPQPLDLGSVAIEPAPAGDPAVAPVSAAPVVGPQARATSGPRQHVATAADSFESLSRSFYGDPRYARALWWANRGDVAWPGALTAGKRIVVPAPGELEPRMIVAPDPVGVASTSTPKPKPAAGRVDPGVRPASFTEPEPESTPESKSEGGGFAVHVVRPADTLRQIAREVCGDERKALEIIALNRDILTAEGRIRVGQRLLMPAGGKPSPE